MNGDRGKNVICLIAMAVVVLLAILMQQTEAESWVHYVAYALSITAFVSLSFLMRKHLSDRPGSQVLSQLGEQADPLLAWEQELEQQKEAMGLLARQLDQRHARLSQKLIAYHE